MKKILEINHLSVSYQKRKKRLYAIDDISFYLESSEILGIVGESGSGKSTIARAILQILPNTANILQGDILFQGKNLLEKKIIRSYRGKKIGIIFQDPFINLNPTMKVGKQITEPLLFHRLCNKIQAKQKVLELLHLMKLPDPTLIFDRFPHELSGGQRQRIMIAIAISCCPDLLIADEPTTALDVTIQMQILDLLLEIKKKMNMSILIITHDLNLISKICDRTLVMYGGKILEQGKTEQIFSNPKHPYTKMLLDSTVSMDKDPLLNPLKPIDGLSPTFTEPIDCCPFFPRCPKAMNICAEKFPPHFLSNHSVCCWLYHEKITRSTEPKEVLSTQKQDS